MAPRRWEPWKNPEQARAIGRPLDGRNRVTILYDEAIEMGLSHADAREWAEQEWAKERRRIRL